CNKGVEAIKLCLCNAQCHSALDQICNYLYIKSRFRMYKGAQVWHQGATTRARGLMNRNNEKICMQAEKYVAMWEAKRLLVGEASIAWHRLDPKKDLHCMDAEEDRAVVNNRRHRKRKNIGEGQRCRDPTGEGRHTISWIWMGVDTSSAATSNTVLTAGLCVEWCKAWA
ncbi:hypothetical protein DFH08DRAFT_659719, partial [Mycena albidolilacea]